MWFKAPVAGKTVSGTLSGSNCYVNGTGVSRVDFFVGTTKVGSDTSMSDGMQCQIDTTQFKNGSYQLKATAYNSSGSSRNDVISININNTGAPPPVTPPSGGTSTPAPGAGALDVWFKSPTGGNTVSGVLNAGTGCYVKASGPVSRVAFSLDNGAAFHTDSSPSDGMQCVLDTTKFANGTHQLKAVAYDASGASRTDVISINIQNAAGGGGTPPPTPGNAAPTVSFTSPAAGATLSGTAAACAASASDDKGVASVKFMLGTTAISTDTSAPYTCSIDTTKVANGSYNLTAVATDSNGATGTATRTVTVSNASAPPPVGSGTPPASLLFWSGFEGALSLTTPNNCYSNGCFQQLLGNDPTTGFKWPISLAGGTNQFQLLVNGPTPTPGTMGTWMTNQVQSVVGHKGTQTQALYSEVRQSGCCGTNPQGGASTQDTFHVYPGAEPGDIYFSKWIKLQPNLAENLAGGDPWRVLFEWKTGGSPASSAGGDFRIILNIVAWGGAKPSWQVTWDNEANGGLPYKQFWRRSNTSVPVPIGEWFKFEAFWHRSKGSDGRAWFAVNGQVIDDHYGQTIGVNNAPIGRIMINQVYTGAPYPIYQWSDDVQIWQGFPSVKPTDPWYDPPYAAH